MKVSCQVRGSARERGRVNGYGHGYVNYRLMYDFYLRCNGRVTGV